MIYKLSKPKFYISTIFSFNIVALCSKKQDEVVVVSREPLSKEAWIVLNMEKVFNILVFCRCSFMQMIKLLPLMIEKMLLQKREKRETTQGDSRAMKHFHFCLTSLKKGIWSPARNQ